MAPTTAGADPAVVVAAVATLLRGLAEAGAECVTAADYEDQLRGSGRTAPAPGVARSRDGAGSGS